MRLPSSRGSGCKSSTYLGNKRWPVMGIAAGVSRDVIRNGQTVADLGGRSIRELLLLTAKTGQLLHAPDEVPRGGDAR